MNIWWYLRRKSNTVHHAEHTIPAVKHGNENVMQWKYFSSAKTEKLVRDDRKNDGVKYRSIPEGQLLDCAIVLRMERDYRKTTLHITPDLLWNQILLLCLNYSVTAQNKMQIIICGKTSKLVFTNELPEICLNLCYFAKNNVKTLINEMFDCSQRLIRKIGSSGYPFLWHSKMHFLHFQIAMHFVLI